jgi:RNA binding exosome subunit
MPLNAQVLAATMEAKIRAEIPTHTTEDLPKICAALAAAVVEHIQQNSQLVGMTTCSVGGGPIVFGQVQ